MHRIDSIDIGDTPALVYDESRLESLLDASLLARERAGCRLLYAVKAASSTFILDRLAPHLDGFSVSSLFEARLIRERFPDTEIHFTSPGIRAEEVLELGGLCQYVAVNSRSQVHRHALEFGRTSSLGVRVNTRISRAADSRYDPCRPSSKLGIPLEQLPAVMAKSPAPVQGLHFHTNSDSEDFNDLLTNVRVLLDVIPEHSCIEWINIGGGYLFEGSLLDPLVAACEMLQDKFGATIFMEPGAGLVRAAGFLVASVLDIFCVDACNIVVLDTTVNHMPEVLEFGYQPDVLGSTEDGDFAYELAGCTCLAGDIFGRYRFPKPLRIGDRVIFEEAGAYTLAKSHRFNGIDFPSVGYLSGEGLYEVRKVFDYGDFRRYWTPNDALPD